MDSGLPMMLTVFAVVEALAQLVVAVIPVAIWQRTKITGFLLLAASFAGSALMSLVSTWVFALMGGGYVLIAVWRLAGLLLLALAAIGLWQVYGELKRRESPTVAG